ncbi:hypothetical protein F5Y19DRAFT_449616 [Xylariaceae sp. FL1651]|nr:hypothetical protein F5Y19DRAFT_449616 [Xylariaceae sp. FL1651]
MAAMKTEAARKSIAFFGASGGCGLSALKHSLEAGHTCVALCRVPSKLTDQFPAATYPNLTVLSGNAHDPAAVAPCLMDPSDPARLVGTVCFSLGSLFHMSKMSTEDPHVCEKGIMALFEALATVRARIGPGAGPGAPRIIAISTNGISQYGWDFPVLMTPLYRGMLHVPHADKKIMEEKIVSSGEMYCLVRPSTLVNGEKPDKQIRVGVEDLHRGPESKEVGYTISREDVGRWIFEHLLQDTVPEYWGKAVSITW